MRGQNESEGAGVTQPETFLEYLDRTHTLDCDLIIGGTEMPATFVWDENFRLTACGMEYYAELLQSPYKLLDNGNIEILCDNYELGEHFTLAAAGHIGTSGHNKLFAESSLD